MLCVRLVSLVLYASHLSIFARLGADVGAGLAHGQIRHNLTSQAATMVTNGVPNDVINNLDTLTLIVFIPICDMFIYPALRKKGINFTPIKRIAAGILTCSAAMVWVAVVQHYVYKVCIALSNTERCLIFVATF